MTLANLKDDSIVLDFFSGSASLAQAVMETNHESGKKIQYILVQIPETVDPKSKAYEAGYRTICDIGIDRIKKATSKIYKENTLLDENVPGFRAFKLASSNMKEIFILLKTTSKTFSMFESNIKEDRTDLDLLFGCLLDWGLELSKPYKSEEIASVAVHTYDEDALVACFVENVPEEVIREIAKRQPLLSCFPGQQLWG